MSTPTSSAQVLLLSSNTRRRYAEDILTALALPPGAILQFRYWKDFVSPSLQIAVADKTIIGAEVIIGFIAEQADPLPFLVPVRHAVLSKAEVVADTYFFQLRVRTYPSLANYPETEDDLRAKSAPLVQQVSRESGARFYPASIDPPSLDLRTSSDAAKCWRGISTRLSVHDTFRNSFFMRVEPPVSQRGPELLFLEDGRMRLVDQRSAKLRVNFLSATYRPEDGYILACRADGNFLRVSSDEAYDVALRYDTVEFWVHPSTNSFDTLASVTISMRASSSNAAASVDPSHPLPTNVRLPVIVQRSKSRLAVRSLTSGSGAILVALPAILGGGSPLALRIVLAGIGAVILAIATVLLGPSNK